MKTENDKYSYYYERKKMKQSYSKHDWDKIVFNVAVYPMVFIIFILWSLTQLAWLL